MRLLRLLALMSLVPTPALASAVVIWPVDPVIRAGEQGTALWLENKGSEPVVMQVRTLAWSQPDGHDRLDRQDAVVASPPIVTVPAGARQLVRLIRRAPDTVPEASYRLVIDELPKPPATDAAPAVQARLQVQMRYSIPLFTLGGAGTPTPPRLDAQLVTRADGRFLLIRNAGTGHARLTDLRAVDGGRETMLAAGLAGYVLPGATLALPVPPRAVEAIRVRVNGADQLLGSHA